MWFRFSIMEDYVHIAKNHWVPLPWRKWLGRTTPVAYPLDSQQLILWQYSIKQAPSAILALSLVGVILRIVMSSRHTSYGIHILHALDANSWGRVTQWINRQNKVLWRNAELNNVIQIFDYGGLCTHCQLPLSTTTLAQMVRPDQTPSIILSILPVDTLAVLKLTSTQRHIGFLTPWSHTMACHVETSH
jgi:hypothetical protein